MRVYDKDKLVKMPEQYRIVRRPGAIRSEVGTADMKFVPSYLLRQL
jgi:hypothetical protein